MLASERGLDRILIDDLDVQAAPGVDIPAVFRYTGCRFFARIFFSRFGCANSRGGFLFYAVPQPDNIVEQLRVALCVCRAGAVVQLLDDRVLQIVEGLFDPII